MLYLLQALARQLQFLDGRLLRLLDEAVQDHDPPPHQGAEERPAYAFPALGPNLEQAITERPGIGQTKVRPGLHHLFGDAREAGVDAGRPAAYLRLYRGVEELDGVGHGGNIACLL